jgi:hypothetical protein
MEMPKKNCVIVILVHSADPCFNELISFEQCFKVLGSHPIKVIAPRNISLKNFRQVVTDFDVIEIDPVWQSSLVNYNKLKLSYFFYDLFKDYEYLLTYELDAFVFKDELLEWCSKGYDYIGAPWFEGYDKPGNKLLGVGNSGFSLRKISTVRECLKTVYFKDPKEFKASRLIRPWAYLKIPFNYLLSIWGENRSIQTASYLHEDRILCDFISKKENGKLSPIEAALKFSFECNPSYLFEINYRQLPMGCHAWWKYDLAFWKPHIERFGYKVAL